MRLLTNAAPLAVIMSMVIVSAAAGGPAEDGNAGLEALQQGDYPHAVALFSRALNSGKMSHDDMEFAYSQRGTAYLKEGKTRLAITDFKHALKLKPDDKDAEAGLEEAQSQPEGSESNGGGYSRGDNASGGGGGAQAAQAGMEALNNGDFARAIQFFTRAINSAGLSADDRELALLSRGKAYTQKGDYRSAVSDLNRALHIKSDDQEAQAALGKALSQMRAPSTVAGIDDATCTKNFSSVGSIFTGKTYTGFAEYPTLSPADAFAGTYTALLTYTPVPGLNWVVTTANMDAGTIAGTIAFADSGRAIALDARIESVAGGSRITLKETVPGLLPTLDLKGSLCHTLADAAKG